MLQWCQGLSPRFPNEKSIKIQPYQKHRCLYVRGVDDAIHRHASGLANLDFNFFPGIRISTHANLSINILKRPESHKRDLAVLLL